jgi:ATP-dependent RNA helicase DDX10/DBP4
MVVCARTGSGKTLSYLIPVVEKLYNERWTQEDGLGALILVPTRELGIQAYEVLRSFGGFHDLSAGLVIGGKDLEKEKEIIRIMNILICTPGRLLQHMDETYLFNGDNL